MSIFLPLDYFLSITSWKRVNESGRNVFWTLICNTNTRHKSGVPIYSCTKDGWMNIHTKHFSVLIQTKRFIGPSRGPRSKVLEAPPPWRMSTPHYGTAPEKTVLLSSGGTTAAHLLSLGTGWCEKFAAPQIFAVISIRKRILCIICFLLFPSFMSNS